MYIINLLSLTNIQSLKFPSIYNMIAVLLLTDENVNLRTQANREFTNS